MRKKAIGRVQAKQAKSSRPQSFYELLKKISIFISFLIFLIILVLGSIWVAGAHLFVLDNNQNLLLSSKTIDGSNGEIYLTYFLPAQQKIQIFSLQSQPMQVMGGYGDYQLNTVYSLLKMEKKDAAFQAAAMSWGLETIVDRVEQLDHNLSLESKKKLQKQLRKILIDNLFNPPKLFETLKLYFFTRLVPVELIQIESQLTSPAQLPTFSTLSLYEDCAVAVVNTTDKPGLAAKMAIILEKAGGVVMRVTDQSGSSPLSTFLIATDNSSCQAFAKRAEALFPTQLIKQENQQLKKEYRADLVILIGEDLVQALE